MGFVGSTIMEFVIGISNQIILCSTRKELLRSLISVRVAVLLMPLLRSISPKIKDVTSDVILVLTTKLYSLPFSKESEALKKKKYSKDSYN